MSNNHSETYKPHYIDFVKIGASDIGYLSVADIQKELPFEPKRVYWVYQVPGATKRGGHANKKNQQVVVCLQGRIEYSTKNQQGEVEKFVLDSPDKGLFVPNMLWKDIVFHDNAILMCISSTSFQEEDYIRNADQFGQ